MNYKFNEHLGSIGSSVQPNTTMISLAGKDPLSVILMSGIVNEMSALAHELDPQANGSYQDFFLFTMGNQIGLRLSLGLINPLELATVIDTTVGPSAFITPNDTWRIGYINPFFLP